MKKIPDSLLEYFNKYNKISAEAYEAIAGISELLSIKKNRDLQSIGHTCRTIYFISKGAARIYYYKDGTDITEHFAFENSISVRVESLFTNKPSRKAIEIIEDAEVVAIDAIGLFKLYDVYPEIERLFRKIFEEGYVETVSRLESIQFHSAKDRYNALLTEHPNILQRVPLKHIASYLGVTQVTLSRIRASAN